MEQMIAHCGLVCSECPAFIATQRNDDRLREETAEMWAKLYNAPLKAADINCDGCLSDGPRLLGHCHVCEIRSCARGRQLTNCGHCADFSCDKLAQIFQTVPEAKGRLTEINSRLA